MGSVMIRRIFISALFSVTLIVGAQDAFAQNITGRTAVEPSITPLNTAPSQPLTATLTIVSPMGDEKFVNGNRYPITWRITVPKTTVPYRLMGEILLLDQNTDQPAQKKDLRIAFLKEDDIAKGSYTFLAGEQKELTYGHTVAPQGKYRVLLYIKAATECGPTKKCAPLFDASATTKDVMFLYH
jgi:hypothetical protein